MGKPGAPFDVNQVLNDLEADDPRTVDAAIGLLETNADLVGEAVYRRALDEPNPRVLGALLHILGATKNDRYVPFIGRVLRTSTGALQFWAYAALSRVASDEARQHLRRVSLGTTEKDPKNP